MKNVDRLVERGRAPWNPTSEAQNTRVLDSFNGPIVGTYEVDGTTAVYECISGHNEIASVWVYLLLSDDQAKYLESDAIDSLDSLHDWLDTQYRGRCVAFAYARNDVVQEWGEWDVEPDASIYSPALAWLRSTDHVRAPRRASRRRRDSGATALEVLDSARRALIPA